MAENERASASDDIQSSLLQARDIIVQLLDGVANSPQNSSANTISTRAILPTHTTPTSEPENSSNIQNQYLHNRAIVEHRRLFGFSGQSVGNSNIQSSGKRSRYGGKSGNSAKAKKTKGATWTHAFVCLAKKSHVLLPSPQERYELKSAGLGEKKITIEIHGKGFDDLYKILLEEFPLLLNAGGIELMRTGFGSKSKSLEVIPVPHGSATYSIEYLKEVLQQAKCYVRPIQRDLSIHTCQDNISTEILEVILKADVH